MGPEPNATAYVYGLQDNVRRLVLVGWWLGSWQLVCGLGLLSLARRRAAGHLASCHTTLLSILSYITADLTCYRFSSCPDFESTAKRPRTTLQLDGTKYVNLTKPQPHPPQADPKLLASCTTGADGWCELPMPPASTDTGISLIGFVVGSGGEGAYAPSAGWWHLVGASPCLLSHVPFQ